MNTDNIATFVTFITAIATLLTSLASLLTLRHYSANLNQMSRFKKFDVYSECMKSYHNLDREKEKNHYENIFWNLQERQFLYWKNGMLENDVYQRWLMARLKEFVEPEENPVTLAWESLTIRAEYDNDFCDLIDCIKEISKDVKDIESEHSNCIFKIRTLMECTTTLV